MILERYIHREILEKVGWVASLLILILASNRFVGYLADAAAGNLPTDMITEMLGMKMLALLPRLLPVAYFLSVMLALSRMGRDKELTIMFGAGMSELFQIKTVTRFSIVYAVVLSLFSLYLSPWAEARVSKLENEAKVNTDISGLAPGQFREFSQGDRVVYVQRLSEDKNSMKDVFLQVRQHNRLGVLTSDSARYLVKPDTGSRYVIFQNGRRYVGKPGMLNYQITRYHNYAVMLDQGQAGATGDDLEGVPTVELIGSNDPMYRAELQWRLASIIAALLLPILGVAMNRFSFSENRYAPVFIAVAIYFIYSNLLSISKTLLKRNKLPPEVGMWWVHVALIVVTVLILKFPAIKRLFRRQPAAAPVPEPQ